MQSTWTKEELAYFAGILDGEGCFCLHSHTAKPSFRGHIYACAIHVGNTDIRLLQWIADRFGGRVFAEQRQNAKWKDVWRWYARTDDMDVWLPAVLPYLIIKRDQAELLMAYRKTLPPKARTHRSTGATTDAVKQQRAQIHANLAMLNKRGAAS